LSQRVLSALAQIGKALSYSAPPTERTAQAAVSASTWPLRTPSLDAICFGRASVEISLPVFLLQMPMRFR
jgi:hypothetical protein